MTTDGVKHMHNGGWCWCLTPPERRTDPTCAERLPEQLASRLEDFRAMLDRDDPDEPGDGADLGPLSEYPLAATVRYHVRVDLSTGGPADYLTADVDSSGDIGTIRYHFADWFDHADAILTGDDYATAYGFIEALYGGDMSDIGEYVRRD